MPRASLGDGDYLDFLACRYEHDAICNDVSQPVTGSCMNGCAMSYAQKQLQLFLGSYFCQLDFLPFTADQDSSKLAVLVCSPFDCSCASTRSHPLPLGKFLAVVCSRYFSLAAVQVSLATYRYCQFSFAFPAP